MGHPPRLTPGWLAFWGWLANLAGLPGLVRECSDQSQLGVTVRVRKSRLFTVVTVNSVDVYFYRLTGGIDGVGFTPSSDYTVGDTARLTHSADSLVD